MYAVEFNAISKDGVIVIPQEYRDELGNREDIRLVVMYDLPVNNYADKMNKELETLEKLFLNSNNEITATKELAINTDGMINDIS
jgi:bifunctional DNA-binding transcriptional regulator/antitoxin component of YhaV-PrlF toxin-antitoxin module